MKDNISIIFATIIGVLIMVILPLVSVLDRQDNMSYNLVMKLTTSFADEVRTKGYIDIDSYNNFTQSLSATGNSYDIQMEAHKKFLIKDSTNANQYIEDTLIDYNTDIFKTMSAEKIDETYESIDVTTGRAEDLVSNKTNAYLLNEGDEFYIKVKNTNETGASVIYNYIAGTSNSEIININYGGIINKKSWEKYEDKLDQANKEPKIKINITQDNNGLSPVRIGSGGETEQKDYIYFFNLQSYGYGLELKTVIEISNQVEPNSFVNMSDEEAIDNGIYQQKILDKIQLEGFTADTKTITKIAGSPYKFELKLTGLSLTTGTVESECKIIVDKELVQGYMNQSIRTESVPFTLVDDSNLHSIAITGPYYRNDAAFVPSTGNFVTDPGTYTPLTEIGGRKTSLVGDEIFFKIEYKGITRPLDEDLVREKIYMVGFSSSIQIGVKLGTYDPNLKSQDVVISMTPVLPMGTVGNPITNRPDNYFILDEGSAYTTKSDLVPTSHKTKSDEFDLSGEHSVNISGPFTTAGGNVTARALTVVAPQNPTSRIQLTEGTQYYFLVEYKEITAAPTVAQISSKVNLSGFTGAVTVSNISYNTTNKTCTARIYITPALPVNSLVSEKCYINLLRGSAMTMRSTTVLTANPAESQRFDVIGKHEVTMLGPYTRTGGVNGTYTLISDNIITGTNIFFKIKYKKISPSIDVSNQIISKLVLNNFSTSTTTTLEYAQYDGIGGWHTAVVGVTPLPASNASLKISADSAKILNSSVYQYAYTSPSLAASSSVFNVIAPVKNYYFTNDLQDYTALYTGRYQIEVWGAQGGNERI